MQLSDKAISKKGNMSSLSQSHTHTKQSRKILHNQPPPLMIYIKPQILCFLSLSLPESESNIQQT